MSHPKPALIPALVLALIPLAASPAGAAPPPKPEAALGIAPLHAVDYSTPSDAEVPQCRVEAENIGKTSSWIVRDPDGQVLRRFSDTNADKQVDVWCYFKDGLEVYRDVDTNFDRKADQHQWYNTGGAKWGVDEDQDERIDRWRRITPREIGEELVRAIQEQDQQAFERLLLSTSELNQLKLDPTLENQFASSLREASDAFGNLSKRQATITRESRCIDFGASRPGALPSRPGSDAPDVVVYEGASALVETAGKSEQLQIGVLVQVGDAWRLVEAPQIGGDNIELSGVFALSKFTSSTGSGAAPPTDEMQRLMEKLQQLDKRMTALSPQEYAKLIPEREKRLLQLAEVTEDRSLREQWYSQLAEMYCSAAMEGHYKDGVKRMGELQAALAKRNASDEVMAHIQYLRIWTDWVLQTQDPKQDSPRVQENWLKQLRAFVKAYPNTTDTAEAYLQLGMTLEFAGETDEALEAYTRLATDFRGSPRGKKGFGAARRINSVGKPIEVAGQVLGGRGEFALSKMRGKHVLVHYWATLYEASKTDMAVINQALAKYRGKGFEVLGVNFDHSPEAAKAFLAENRYPWRQLYDTGGIEGRLASEMGVMTLPLMILVDDQGRVVNRNLHATELEAELKRLLR